MVSRCTARCEISPKRRYESTEARSDSWTGFSLDIWYRRIAFRVNVKSRLIKLVLLPLGRGDSYTFGREEESIPVEFSSRRVVFNGFTSAVSRNGRLCGTADGNSRVSAGYYEFYYICLRWYFRTNEHITKAIKVLVTYWIINYYIDLNLSFNMLTPIKKQGDEHIYILL